jgi:predicted transcriptional regulator
MDKRARYDIMVGMTKKLEDAITKVRELSDDDQDMAADVLLSIIAEPIPLDDEARSAIREGLDQARRGEFVPDEEIQALWKRHGL